LSSTRGSKREAMTSLGWLYHVWTLGKFHDQRDAEWIVIRV
jgi:hypothetical protein